MIARFLAWWRLRYVREFFKDFRVGSRCGAAHADYAEGKIDWVEWQKRLAEAEDA